MIIKSKQRKKMNLIKKIVLILFLGVMLFAFYKSVTTVDTNIYYSLDHLKPQRAPFQNMIWGLISITFLIVGLIF